MLDDGTMLASFTSFAIMWKDCGTSSIPLFLLLQSGLGGGEGGGGYLELSSQISSIKKSFCRL